MLPGKQGFIRKNISVIFNAKGNYLDLLRPWCKFSYYNSVTSALIKMMTVSSTNSELPSRE